MLTVVNAIANNPSNPSVLVEKFLFIHQKTAAKITQATARPTMDARMAESARRASVAANNKEHRVAKYFAVLKIPQNKIGIQNIYTCPAWFINPSGV